MTASASILVLDRVDPDEANALALARQIGDQLEQTYPGWLWFVEVSGGMAAIKSMHANPKYGYRLRLGSDHYSASDMKAKVIRAGGELLERLGLPRRRADWDAIAHAPNAKVGFLEYQR